MSEKSNGRPLKVVLVFLALTFVISVAAILLDDLDAKRQAENALREQFRIEFGFLPETSDTSTTLIRVQYRMDMLCKAFKVAEMGRDHVLGMEENLKKGPDASAKDIILYDELLRVEEETVAFAERRFLAARELAATFDFSPTVHEWCKEMK